MNTSITTTIIHEIICSFKTIPAGTYSLPDDADRLAQELLINLGLVTRTSSSSSSSSSAPPPPLPPFASVSAPAPAPAPAPDSAAARKRTVSKKMKDSLLAAGKTEDDLKRIIDAYKKASDSDIAAAGGSFESFAASVLAAPTSTPAPSTPKTKSKAKAETTAEPTAEPKAPSKPSKKAEKGRISWTAAEKKVFKEVVESSGGLVTPELTSAFTTYVNDLSPESFDSLALSGHMRAWISPSAGAGHSDLQQPVLDDNEDNEDEDLLEFTHNDEMLLIGEKSGKIFLPSPQEGMPDVMVGIAGQGKYTAVKKPSA